MTRKRVLTAILVAVGGLLVVGAAGVLAMPAILHGQGLHPVYTGQRYLLPG